MYGVLHPGTLDDLLGFSILSQKQQHFRVARMHLQAFSIIKAAEHIIKNLCDTLGATMRPSLSSNRHMARKQAISSYFSLSLASEEA